MTIDNYVPTSLSTTCLSCSQNPECSRKSRTQQLPWLVRTGNLEPLRLPSGANRAQAAAPSSSLLKKEQSWEE